MWYNFTELGDYKRLNLPNVYHNQKELREVPYTRCILYYKRKIRTRHDGIGKALKLWIWTYVVLCVHMNFISVKCLNPSSLFLSSFSRSKCISDSGLHSLTWTDLVFSILRASEGTDWSSGYGYFLNTARRLVSWIKLAPVSLYQFRNSEIKLERVDSRSGSSLSLSLLVYVTYMLQRSVYCPQRIEMIISPHCKR
jgi:hypothetical protein